MRHLRPMLHVLKKCLVVGAGSYLLKTIMTNWEIVSTPLVSNMVLSLPLQSRKTNDRFIIINSLRE